MSATIRDVAKRAGVGVATVSRVLNNSGYARPETRERVHRAAAELGFVPSQLARGLVSRSSETIGLVIPDITNPFFPAVTRGVEDGASEAGYTVFLCNTDNDPALEAIDVQKLRERRVDGIIFVGTTDRHDLVERLLGEIPVVVADRHVEHASIDSVLVDNLAGARAACSHLLDLGHTRIAHLAGNQRTRTAQERCEGYQSALLAAGLPYDERMVAWGDFTYDSGLAMAQVLLGRSPRPTAIFAANDLIAFGAMRAAEDGGLSLPDDLSVVGFDDIPMASVLRPGLTTIRQPAYEMGRLAITMLLERIEGRVTGAGRKHRFQPELVVRSTTRRRESIG